MALMMACLVSLWMGGRRRGKVPKLGEDVRLGSPSERCIAPGSPAWFCFVTWLMTKAKYPPKYLCGLLRFFSLLLLMGGLRGTSACWERNDCSSKR